MGHQFKVQGTDWVLEVPDDEEGVIPNFELFRESGKHFHLIMVDDYVVSPDGSKVHFRKPLIFEHSKPQEQKIGDVVITIRRNPSTGRYTVQTEKENVFVFHDSIEQITRAVRSSVDNPEQAIHRKVRWVGWIYSNPARIGGMPIKTHFEIAGWSPQLVAEAMDVYDYVRTSDALGLAAFLQSLQVMPEDLAQRIFEQIRSKG